MKVLKLDQALIKDFTFKWGLLYSYLTDRMDIWLVLIGYDVNVLVTHYVFLLMLIRIVHFDC